MVRALKLTIKNLSLAFLFGCASTGEQFFDSAMNDRNRAPASLQIPKTVDGATSTIDSMQVQSEADFLYLKAEMASQAGRGAESISLINEALTYDPTSATLMQKMAIELYKLAKLAEATKWAEKAQELAPNRRDLNLLLAGLYTATRNYSKAEVIYKRLLKNDAEDVEALLYLGAVYTEEKSYVKAAEIFKKLSRHPSYSSKYLAHYYLARVYSEQNNNNTEAVLAELKAAIHQKPDFIEAVSMVGQIIEVKSGKEKAHAYYAEHQKKYGPNSKLAETLAQYYITKNEYDKAYVQLEILDELSSNQVQVKLKMALILIEKKIYDKAILKLNEILAVVPESDKVRFYLAAVYEERKEFSKAYDEYLKVQKESNYFEDARLHAGYLAKLMNKSEQALSLLQESIKLEAKNPQTYFLISQIYEDQKDHQKALTVLTEALKKFEKSVAFNYYLGTLQDRLNMKDNMVESMKKVIALDPDHVQALNYLAYNWAEAEKELELAEAYARKAVSKEKTDAYILDTLGWVLFKKGKYKEALKTLDKAHSMQPNASVIIEHLGDIYSKMNQHEKARQMFIRAADVENDSIRKNEIKIKISKIEEQLNNSRLPSSIGTNSSTEKSP